MEDETLVRAVMADELRDVGFDIVEAASGAEAQPVAEALTLDLLITDIRLPGEWSGWDVAKHFRKLQPSLPIIYVTGYSDVDRPDLEKSSFLRKPFRPSVLVNLVHELSGGPPK